MKKRVTVEGCQFWVDHYDGNTVVRPAKGEGETVEYPGTIPPPRAAAAYLHGYDPRDEREDS